MNREEMSRHERETRAQRIIVMSFAGLAVLLVALLGFGWWRTYVSRGAETVASVAGTNVTMDQYADRLDLNRKNLEQQIALYQAQYAANSSSPIAQLYQQQIQQLQFSLALLPEQTLDQMVDENLVRQEAARRGIKATNEDVDAEINTNFGDPPTPVPQPTTVPDPAATAGPTATPAPTATAGASPTAVPTADVPARVNEALLTFGMTREELRSIMEFQVLYRKLYDVMGAEVATTADQVHARHILVETEDKAKEVIARLKAGEKFEDVAKAESKDDSNKDTGGDLGWFSKGQMVPEFDSAVFGLQVNQLSEPVKTSFGYHIIEVLEKDPNRKLSESDLAQKKGQAIQDWLDKARTAPEVKRDLTDEKKKWAYEKIKWTPPALGT